MGITSVNGAGNSGSNKPDQKLVQECGVQFGEGLLKRLESSSTYTTVNGELKRETKYRATLTGGTTISFAKQQKGAKVVKSGEHEYDFEKLNDSAIIGAREEATIYNLMGCKFTYVDVQDNKPTDKSCYDKVRIGDYEDGTKSEGNFVVTDECDSVEKGEGHISGKEGMIVSEHDDGLGTYNTLNSRTIKVLNDGTKKTYSHDGKLLKDSYVNAKERKLSDGYSIKTSQDGTEKWYYDPSGKPITPKEFIEAKHPYKIKVKKSE
jgi:hypothetical protein